MPLRREKEADTYQYDPIVDRRLRDLLAAGTQTWRICEVLGLSEYAIRLHYAEAFIDRNRDTGIKPWTPSPVDRQKARAMASVGLQRRHIALALGISVQTLRLHFDDDIELASIETNAKVAAKMLVMANGPPDGRNTFLAAKWWTATQMGWREDRRVELTGPDGGPIQNEAKVVVVLPDNGRGEGPSIDGDALDVTVNGADEGVPEQPGPAADDPQQEPWPGG